MFRPTISDEVIARIRELYAQGLSIAKIAEETGVSCSSVRRKINIKSNGSKRKTKSMSPTKLKQLKTEIEELREQGFAYDKIAAQLNISIYWVYKLLGKPGYGYSEKSDSCKMTQAHSYHCELCGANHSTKEEADMCKETHLDLANYQATQIYKDCEVAPKYIVFIDNGGNKYTYINNDKV